MASPRLSQSSFTLPWATTSSATRYTLHAQCVITTSSLACNTVITYAYSLFSDISTVPSSLGSLLLLIAPPSPLLHSSVTSHGWLFAFFLPGVVGCSRLPLSALFSCSCYTCLELIDFFEPASNLFNGMFKIHLHVLSKPIITTTQSAPRVVHKLRQTQIRYNYFCPMLPIVLF